MVAFYEKGPRHSESIAVDERGHVFVLTNDEPLATELFHAPFRAGETWELNYISEWNLTSLPAGIQERANGADFDLLHRRLAVRTTSSSIEIELDPDQNLEQSAGTPWRLLSTTTNLGHVDAIGYRHAGGLIQASSRPSLQLWKQHCGQ